MGTEAVHGASPEGLDSSGIPLSGRTTWVHYAERWGIYVALLVAIATFAALSPLFLNPRNLINIGNSAAVVGIMAAGVTICLIAGYIDITVGAVLALTTVVIAVSLEQLHLPLWVALVVAVASAVVVALVNAVLVVSLAIPSIVVSLAMTLVVTGIAQLIGGGLVVHIEGFTALQWFFAGRPFGIPMPFLVLLIVYAVAFIVLRYTRTGWHLYALGGNPSAALRSAIKVNRIVVGSLVASALLAALAGTITVGRAASGSGAYGYDLSFQVFTAVLLGGAGIFGGYARIERTFVAVLFIGVLNNGMTLLGINAYVQDMVNGFAFVFAVVVSALAIRRTSR